MRGEQRVDRIIGDEPAGHPHAGAQGVAENTPLEDGEEESAHLALLDALALPVLADKYELKMRPRMPTDVT
jgi:hypothetical protein